jgi:hypothetical protein
MYAAPLGEYNDTDTNDAIDKGDIRIDHFLLLIQKMLCMRKIPDVEFIYRCVRGHRSC